MTLALALLLAASPATPGPSPDRGLAPTCDAAPLPTPDDIKRALDYEEGRDADRISAGSRTGQPALRARLPVMPGAVTPLVDISDGMVTYGVPLNLASFETEAGAREVLSYYAHYFQQRRWDITAPSRAATVVPYPALSATDNPEGLQLSVMVMGRAPKGSTVILGLADMKTVMEKKPRPWKEPELGDLPLYPGSDPMALTAVDQELRERTVSFDTGDSVTKVVAFYRKEMTSRGYEESSQDLPDDGRTVHLQFQKSGHAWTMALSPGDPRAVVTAMGREEAHP